MLTRGKDDWLRSRDTLHGTPDINYMQRALCYNETTARETLRSTRETSELAQRKKSENCAANFRCYRRDTILLSL